MSVARDAMFDPEIHVPWHDDFALYRGVDALTGKIKGPAVEYIAIDSSDEGDERSTGIDTFRAMHDKRSSQRVAANATINLGFPVTPGVKVNYESLNACSSSSSFVEHWVDGHYKVERVPPKDRRLKLNPQAKEDARDPKRFREQYGDYFVCGFQRRYSFRAIATETTRGAMHIHDVGAGANVSVGNLVAVGGHADVSRSSEGDTDVGSVFIYCYGCFPRSMSGCAHFKANNFDHAMRHVQDMECPGVYHTAILQHYSDIEPLIPKTVPVNSDVFSELHCMDILYLNLELALSHPAIDKQDTIDASRAITLFERGRETFVDDSGARRDAYQALEGATREIKNLLELRDHRFRIERILLQKSPPKLHEEFKTDGERQEFGYRLASGEITISNEKCREVDLQHGLRGWECLLKANEEKKHLLWPGRHYTADLLFHSRATQAQQELPNEFSPGFLATIVGFSLSCNDKSAKFVITTGGILSSSLSVRVEALYGAEWHCRILFVEDKYGYLGSHMD